MVHRRLLDLAREAPAVIARLAALGIALSAVHVAFALSLASVLAALIRGDATTVWKFGTLAVLAITRALLTWLREVAASAAGAQVRVALRRRLLAPLASVPAHERDSGTAVTTVIDGVEGLDPYFTKYLPQLIVTLIVPVAVTAWVWRSSNAVGIVLAVAVVGAVVLPRFWDARLLANGRERWAAFEEIQSSYVEALQNIPLLRAFGATDRFSREFSDRAEALRALTMRQLRVSLIESGVSALAMHGGTALSAFAALWAVARGDKSMAAAILVFILSREAFRPVQELAQAWHAGYLGLTAVDGIERLMSRTSLAEGPVTAPVSDGAVSVSDVHYEYPGTESGLHGVSLEVPAGESLAVIGPSGSGKSTLARLLERDVDPRAGDIVVGGTPLRDLSSTARARSIIVVPQDPVLFAWSIRDNLRLYRPEATDSDLKAAAKAAYIHDVIMRLDSGYDTVLTENGEQLSGGQRQRLAVARALVSDAPVLVLDEVTSALDSNTEQGVMQSLSHIAGQRTLITIAHRESACRHATSWVRFERGKVAAVGDGAPSATDFHPAGARTSGGRP